MTTDSLLAKLSTAPIQYLPLDEILAIEDLQKRRPSVMDKRAQSEDQAQREHRIADITSTLKDHPEFQSQPLWVVRCIPESDGSGFTVSSEARNYLVDGFHRYEGYCKAGRASAPVQLVEGSWLHAEDIATVSNRYKQTIPVDQSQKLQQAWEMVSRHFDHQLGSLRAHTSARGIAKQTGINHQTVNNMVKKVVELGKSASDLTWRQARSGATPREFSEFQRLRHLVRLTLELAGKAEGEHELESMIRVLQDEKNGVVGYNPDIDAYTEGLLAEGEAELAF